MGINTTGFYAPFSLKCGVAAIALTAAICSGAAQAASPEQAKAWPTRPVKIIVPFAPGGAVEALVRPLADKLAKYNDQPFVIENRPGAAGNIGAGVVARAEPDGYQLLFAPGSVLTMNPSLYSRVPFDANSFVPVSLVGDMPVLLVLNANNPAASVSDFVAAAKRNPDGIFFSSPGAGSSLHLAIELFRRDAGVSLQHVAYKGGGEAVTAILSGQVTGMFANPPLVMSHIKKGTLRALAVAGATRMPQLPDVPATSEVGLAGFDISSLFGLVAPAGTPAAIVDQLSGQIAHALKEPDLQAHLAAVGIRAIGSSPAAFAKVIEQERAKWDRVIRAANVRIE